MRETAQKSPVSDYSPVKDFERMATPEFVGGEGDGYFDTMGHRFESCHEAASKRLHVAQQVEQSGSAS
jgi:hypothetical protein